MIERIYMHVSHSKKFWISLRSKFADGAISGETFLMEDYGKDPCVHVSSPFFYFPSIHRSGLLLLDQRAIDAVKIVQNCSVTNIIWS